MPKQKIWYAAEPRAHASFAATSADTHLHEPIHAPPPNRLAAKAAAYVPNFKMDFSSTHAALRSLKRRSTTSVTLRTLAEKLEGPFAGELGGES